jgi:hypothetical protein
MMPTARVETLVAFEIDVPEGTTKQDIYNFLAENTSFRDAFVGVSDKDQEFRITEVDVIEDEIVELDGVCYDD